MTRRKLNPDEIDLWHRVAETAQRLHPERKGADLPLPKPKPIKQPRGWVSDVTIGESRQTATTSHDIAAPIADRLRQQPVRMDRKTFNRMSRGKLDPEARIDLHGMTLDRAHGALVRFILSAHHQQKRLVLVITGKGKQRDEGGPIPVRHGVLRHQVPHWLEIPPLAQAVLQIKPAHLSHGGDGAYYVYLRRHR